MSATISPLPPYVPVLLTEKIWRLEHLELNSVERMNWKYAWKRSWTNWRQYLGVWTDWEGPFTQQSAYQSVALSQLRFKLLQLEKYRWNKNRKHFIVVSRYKPGVNKSPGPNSPGRLNFVRGRIIFFKLATNIRWPSVGKLLMWPLLSLEFESGA